MRSKAEQKSRRTSFEYLMDSERDSFKSRTTYFGIVNPNILAVCELDDPMINDLYLHIENIILDRFYGV